MRPHCVPASAAPRPRNCAGTNYLARATHFLSARRFVDPLGGMWDAADVQWWWREDDFDRPDRQRFYVGRDGAARAMLLLSERYATFDYDLAPGEEVSALGRQVFQAGMAWLDELRPTRYGTSPSFYVRDSHNLLHRLAEQHGYRPTGDALVQGVARMPAVPANASLPDGYSVRPVRHDDVHAGRQPVLTTPAWGIERLRQTRLYRPDHHLVVADRDGRAVAECIVWIDPSTRIGVLEPVATHPDHRRRGLARGMISFALQVMVQQGIDVAKVSWGRRNAAAAALYRSVGFTPSFERLLYAA